MTATRMQSATHLTKLMAFLTRRRSLFNFFMRLNKWFWERIPVRLRDSKPLRSYGTMLHRLVRRRANRSQFTGTFFFRNRPQLELMRCLAEQKPEGATLRIAVLGCSIGAEVYSIAATLRAARPDLNVLVCAVDNSAEVLKIAKEAIYTSSICHLVGESIFERMTDAEFAEMFQGDRRRAKVRSQFTERISWHLDDACSPKLTSVLGPQDFVVASNFLCHMDPIKAENCLRNVAELAKREGGYLFVTGIDLDVRAKVARELGWRPVPERIEEIHEGDPSVREDWPWAWWGLEPLDKRRAHWQMRYATVFTRE